MEIVKVDGIHWAEDYENALRSNFASTPVVSKSSDGTITPSQLPPAFLLEGLLGLSASSIIIFGVSGCTNSFELSRDPISDAEIQEFLVTQLHGVPGLKKVSFARFDRDSTKIGIARLEWDWSVKAQVRDAVGANFTPRAWNFATQSKLEKERQSHVFGKNSFRKFVELRRNMAPDAIEVQVDPVEIPRLLGFFESMDSLSSAVAAFSMKYGIKPAIYVQSGLDEHVPLSILHSLVDGSSDDRLRHPDQIPTNSHMPLSDVPLTKSTTSIGKVIREAGFHLGEDVFTIVETVALRIGHERELFRGKYEVPSRFNSAQFAEVMQELIVNAFCHGAWGTREVGRDENEHREGSRVAIIHAGNRLEIINPLRESGHLANRIGFETYSRRSALHNAFVDVRIAQGRRSGKAMVRQRLAALGMCAPIFVQGRGVHRVMLPFSIGVPGWCALPPSSRAKTENLLPYFTLALAQKVGELDEDLLASALYIRTVDASKVLMKLTCDGALRRTARSPSAPWSQYGPSLLPSYSVEENSNVTSLMDDLSQDFIFFSAPYGVSLGGLYQLSERSAGHLGLDDLRDYVRSLYVHELGDGPATDEELDRHMRTLKANGLLIEGW